MNDFFIFFKLCKKRTCISKTNGGTTEKIFLLFPGKTTTLKQRDEICYKIEYDRYISWRYKMKIILVGGGKVGSALCRSLVAENHDVVLIEQDEAVLNHLTKRYDIIGILGNGANFKVLEQANIESCDIFISMTEQDEVNMVSAVLAKKMGAKETVVRVRNPEYSNPFFKEKNILGFSLVVNPEQLAARSIANIIDFPNALSVEHFANGRVALMEFKVKENSPLCQTTISDFRKQYGNVIICAIERNNELTIPDGDVSIQANDKIYDRKPLRNYGFPPLHPPTRYQKLADYRGG